MKITEKERAVLQSVIDSEYHDGNDPVDNHVYTFSVEPPRGSERKSLGGIIASLEKKGLVNVDEYEGDDTIAITAKGFEMLEAAPTVIEEPSPEAPLPINPEHIEFIRGVLTKALRVRAENLADAELEAARVKEGGEIFCSFERMVNLANYSPAPEPTKTETEQALDVMRDRISSLVDTVAELQAQGRARTNGLEITFKRLDSVEKVTKELHARVDAVRDSTSYNIKKLEDRSETLGAQDELRRKWVKKLENRAEFLEKTAHQTVTILDALLSKAGAEILETVNKGAPSGGGYFQHYAAFRTPEGVKAIRGEG